MSRYSWFGGTVGGVVVIVTATIAPVGGADWLRRLDALVSARHLEGTLGVPRPRRG